MLATHHGFSPSNNPTAAEICQVLKLKLDQMIKDTLANIKLQSTPQPAALTITATMAMMMMMMMMTPPAHPLCHHDPVDLAVIHHAKEPKHT